MNKKRREKKHLKYIEIIELNDKCSYTPLYFLFTEPNESLLTKKKTLSKNRLTQSDQM